MEPREGKLPFKFLDTFFFLFFSLSAKGEFNKAKKKKKNPKAEALWMSSSSRSSWTEVEVLLQTFKEFWWNGIFFSP